MILELRYFGRISELIGKESERIVFEDNITVGELKERRVELKNQVYQIAVNQKICENNFSIESDAEVAFLPPFAGG